MPLEIKELHINVSVNPGEGNQQSPAGAGGGQAGGASDSGGNQAQMIQTVIEQVMEILQEKMER